MKIVEIPIEIEVLTGLRIGSEKESFEVGGVDGPILKIAFKKGESLKRLPIIPGSSLKGRMRFLLEKEFGIKCTNDGKPKDEIENGDSEDVKRVKTLFGSAEGVKLIFSDLLPTEETIKLWEKLEEKEYTYDFGTETKVENMINRNDGKAKHPRTMERIVKGSVFKGTLTLIYNSEEDDKKELQEDLKIIRRGLELVSKTYLGGCGTRGYGRIKIKISVEGKEESFYPQYIADIKS